MLKLMYCASLRRAAHTKPSPDGLARRKSGRCSGHLEAAAGWDATVCGSSYLEKYVREYSLGKGAAMGDDVGRGASVGNASAKARADRLTSPSTRLGRPAYRGRVRPPPVQDLAYLT